MMHDKRIWCLHEVESPERLASQLTETVWTPCSAFVIKGHYHYVWLNDSTSADGAQEFAVVKRSRADGECVQLESITFGWSDYHSARSMIVSTLNGEDDNNQWRQAVCPTIQSPQNHGRCRWCA